MSRDLLTGCTQSRRGDWGGETNNKPAISIRGGTALLKDDAALRIKIAAYLNRDFSAAYKHFFPPRKTFWMEASGYNGA